MSKKVVHLTDDAHNLAKDFCKEKGLKMSDWVAALIRDAVAAGRVDVNPKPDTRASAHHAASHHAPSHHVASHHAAPHHAAPHHAAPQHSGPQHTPSHHGPSHYAAPAHAQAPHAAAPHASAAQAPASYAPAAQPPAASAAASNGPKKKALPKPESRPLGEGDATPPWAQPPFWARGGQPKVS